MTLSRLSGGAPRGVHGLAGGARTRGFTLAELMIVVVVIGILATIAWPSYLEFVRKGNRADAKAILMENAQFMERFFTTNGKFEGAPVLTAVSPKGSTGADRRYEITFSAGPTVSTFTLQAVPVNGQYGDYCETLTISHTGAQTPSTAGCW